MITMGPIEPKMGDFGALRLETKELNDDHDQETESAADEPN
jgi:hypothetical protein